MKVMWEMRADNLHFIAWQLDVDATFMIIIALKISSVPIKLPSQWIHEKPFKLAVLKYILKCLIRINLIVREHTCKIDIVQMLPKSICISLVLVTSLNWKSKWE